MRTLILINFVSLMQSLGNGSYPGEFARDVLAWCPHLESIDISVLAAGGAQHFRRFYQADTGGAGMPGSIIDPDIVFSWKKESRFDGVIDRIEAATVQPTL